MVDDVLLTLSVSHCLAFSKAICTISFMMKQFKHEAVQRLVGYQRIENFNVAFVLNEAV